MGFDWPWRRRAAPPPEPERAHPAPRPDPMGWAFLPPIQRSLSAPIAPVSQDFVPDSWQTPAFTDRQLSHAVAAEVPGGVIDYDGHGIAEPVASPTPSPEFTLLPPDRPRRARQVQRAVATDEPLRPPAPSGPSLTSVSSEAFPAVQRRVVESEPAAPRPSPPSILDDETPVVPPQHSDESPLVPEQPPPSSGAPPSTLPEQPRRTPNPAAGSDLTLSRSPRQPADRPPLGLGAPLPAMPEQAVDRPPQPVQRSASEGFTSVDIPDPRSSGAPPRPRPNVAPLRPTPPTPELPLQRSAAAPHTPDPDRTTEAAADPVAEPDSEPATHPVAEPDSEPATHPVAEPHQTESTDARGPSPDRDPYLVAAPGATDAVMPDPPGVTGQVPVGQAPLPLATGIQTSLQRSTTLPGPGAPVRRLAVRPATGPAQPTGPVVRVQRIPTAGTATTIGPATAAPRAAVARPTEPARQGRAGHLPASPQSGVGPPATVSGPDDAPSAPMLPTPAEADRQYVPLTAPGTTPPADRVQPDLPAPTTDARPASARAVVQREAAPTRVEDVVRPSAATDLSLPVRSAPTDAPAMQERDTVASVQRFSPGNVAPGSGEPPGGSSITGSPDGASPVADPGTTPVTSVQRTETTSARAPDERTSDDPKEMDALARQLFPPMLRMMRSQLLIDRERRGIRTDRW